jgi:hypothetical protein
VRGRIEGGKPARELRPAAKLAVADGWVIRTRSRHTKWYSPDGVTLVVTSSSPSDQRAYQNAIGDLRKAGLRV